MAGAASIGIQVEPLGAALGRLGVLGAEERRALQAAMLADLLGRVPGVGRTVMATQTSPA